MEFTLIRGKTPEEISAAYKKVGRDEQVESAFKPPYRVQLEPSPTKGPAKGTLQKGTFTFVREGKDYGESYYLLVRTVRRWAPEDVVSQDFAIAVTLDANEPQLYARLSARLRARTRART